MNFFRRLWRGGLAPEQVPKPAASAPVATEMASENADHERRALADAGALLEAKDIAGARAALEPFAASSQSLDVLLVLGRTRMALGDLGGAQAVLRCAESLHAMEPGIWAALAELHGLRREHGHELAYRRKLVYLVPAPSAVQCVKWMRAFIHLGKEATPGSVSELKLVMDKVAKADDSTPELEMQFLESLYAVRGFEQKVASRYRTLSPTGEREHDVEARWSSMAEWCERSGAPLHRQTLPLPGSRPIQLGELTDVLVAPAFQWVPVVDEGRVALDGFIMHRMKPRRELAASPVMLHNARSLELRWCAQPRVVETPALLIGGMAQYYHHTVDFLSALAVAEKLGVGTDLPLVVNDDLAPFQSQQLSLLGYAEDRLIRVRADEQVLFRRLCVPSRLVHGGQWADPLVAHWYRARFSSLLAPAAVPAKKLYVSRRHTGRRRVVNEDEVEQALRGLGYVTVYPEQLEQSQQIELFSQAVSVVGPTGAAMTNMVYMPAGGQIVVPLSTWVAEASRDRDMFFDALAAACGHRFAWLPSEPAAFDGDRLVDADVRIDVGALVEAIQALGPEAPSRAGPVNGSPN